ncbi:MAG TPA: cysteine--tRNA ligase [Hyphomicrobiaceae bacterium]|nr:cysteine--tRNA ligase [Hyphomicrobiaceae bacterium]
MMLTLYNTLTRKKQAFVPIDPGNVRMYVCGPTVYNFAHIGNARPIIVFDLLFRLLRHLYGPEHVTYARNITDVDDKINARAGELYPDLPPIEAIRRLTQETTEQFHQDIGALGVLPPTVEPRATETIGEMRALIEALVARGHAYVANEHVLFDVSSMPDYGRLANRSLEEMEAGARVDVAPYKKGPMDFVLWKPSPAGVPAWDSPCGIAAKGRPGWHIECSAMADKFLWQLAKGTLSANGLAQPHVFDIHGGGIDLVFPHHENEIAQTRCSHDTEAMASVWMHNGFLQVEGEKMSKSVGNFVTIRELLDAGWDGRVLHFTMLKTHYRQPINWTRKGMVEAALELNSLRQYLAGPRLADEHGEAFIAALNDDLNTPGAIAELHRMARAAHDPAAAEPTIAKARARVANALALIGVDDLTDFDANAMLAKVAGQTAVDQDTVRRLISARSAARKQRDFATADGIRDRLASMGVQLKDAKDPVSGDIVTTWEVRFDGFHDEP